MKSKKILSMSLLVASMFGLFSCGKGNNVDEHTEMDEGERIQLTLDNYSSYLSVSYSCSDLVKGVFSKEVIGYKVSLNVTGNSYLYYAGVSVTLEHNVSLLNTDGIYVEQPTDYVTVSTDSKGNGSNETEVQTQAEHRGTSSFNISSVSGYITKM